jgi:hypothetical protein
VTVTWPLPSSHMYRANKAAEKHIKSSMRALSYGVKHGNGRIWLVRYAEGTSDGHNTMILGTYSG